MKSESVVVFEWGNKSEIVEIHCNPNGLEKLKNIIEHLLTKIDCNHVHLMTSE